MHYFCISLPEANNRKRFMESQLRRLGVEFTWVAGLDGRALKEGSFREFSDQEYQFRTNGQLFAAEQVGRALSHLKAYRKMLESGYGRAVILEDDTLLDRDITRHVDKMAQTLSVSEPEIILLGPIEAYFLEGKTLIDRYQLVDVAAAGLAWGYIINARAARLMMQHNFPIRFLAGDWDRATYFTGCHLRAVVPSMVTSRDAMGGISVAAVPDWPRRLDLIERIGAALRTTSLMQVPLRLHRWWRGLLRRRQTVTRTQTQLRRPPLTSVPSSSPARAVRD